MRKYAAAGGSARANLVLVRSQSDELRRQLARAEDRVAGWADRLEVWRPDPDGSRTWLEAMFALDSGRASDIREQLVVLTEVAMMLGVP
jgi:hypothetical protein